MTRPGLQNNHWASPNTKWESPLVGNGQSPAPNSDVGWTLKACTFFQEQRQAEAQTHEEWEKVMECWAVPVSRARVQGKMTPTPLRVRETRSGCKPHFLRISENLGTLQYFLTCFNLEWRKLDENERYSNLAMGIGRWRRERELRFMKYLLCTRQCAWHFLHDSPTLSAFYKG